MPHASRTKIRVAADGFFLYIFMPLSLLSHSSISDEFLLFEVNKGDQDLA
jgi:hypothetical protein